MCGDTRETQVYRNLTGDVIIRPHYLQQQSKEKKKEENSLDCNVFEILITVRERGNCTD